MTDPLKTAAAIKGTILLPHSLALEIDVNHTRRTLRGIKMTLQGFVHEQPQVEQSEPAPRRRRR